MTNEYKALKNAIKDEKEKIEALEKEVSQQIYVGNLSNLHDKFNELMDRMKGFDVLCTQVNRDIQNHIQNCYVNVLTKAYDYNDTMKFHIAHMATMVGSDFKDLYYDDNRGFSAFDDNGLPTKSIMVHRVANGIDYGDLKFRQFEDIVKDLVRENLITDEEMQSVIDIYDYRNINFINIPPEVIQYLDDETKKLAKNDLLYDSIGWFLINVADDSDIFNIKDFEDDFNIVAISKMYQEDPSLSYALKKEPMLQTFKEILAEIVQKEECNEMLDGNNYRGHSTIGQYPNICNVLEALDVLEKKFEKTIDVPEKEGNISL